MSESDWASTMEPITDSTSQSELDTVLPRSASSRSSYPISTYRYVCGNSGESSTHNHHIHSNSQAITPSGHSNESTPELLDIAPEVIRLIRLYNDYDHDGEHARPSTRQPHDPLRESPDCQSIRSQHGYDVEPERGRTTHRLFGTSDFESSSGFETISDSESCAESEHKLVNKLRYKGKSRAKAKAKGKMKTTGKAKAQRGKRTSIQSDSESTSGFQTISDSESGSESERKLINRLRSKGKAKAKAQRRKKRTSTQTENVSSFDSESDSESSSDSGSSSKDKPEPVNQSRVVAKSKFGSARRFLPFFSRKRENRFYIKTPGRNQISPDDSDSSESESESESEVDSKMDIEYCVPEPPNFNLTIGDYWKPSDRPFQNWIEGTTGKSVERLSTPARARFQSSTGGTNPGSPENDTALDHASTREGLRTVSEDGLNGNSRANKLAYNSMRVACRATKAVFEPLIGRRNLLRLGIIPRTPDPIPTFGRGTSGHVLSDHQKMRFVFVGEAECGKTSLILRYDRQSFNHEYRPTSYNMYTHVAEVDGTKLHMELWDTAGLLTREPLARLNYLGWDCIFLCYNIDSRQAFRCARNEWIDHICHHAPGVPVILVGTKTDMRDGSSLRALLPEDNRSCSTVTPVPTLANQGIMAADVMGAAEYVECSAKSGEGIDAVIEVGVRTVFAARKAAKSREEKKQMKEDKAGRLRLPNVLKRLSRDK